MKSFQRSVHDLYASVSSRAGIKLKRCTTPDALKEFSPTLLHPAGEAQLDNSLESDFYELPETRIVQVRWPQANLFHLRNVWVAGDQGNTFLKDGRLLSVCRSTQELADGKIRRPIPLGAKRIREPVFHLTGTDHSSHGHFILNHLPRLMIARELLQNDSRIKVLCAPRHRHWQMRYLGHLGIDPERVIECSQGTIHVEELYYTPMINGSHDHPDPAIYLDIRDRIIQKILRDCPPPHSPPGKPIFISRLDAPAKRIKNEDALVDATREVFGDVEQVFVSKLSLEEQIRKFNTASVVIGAVGQGLTNILFTERKVMAILDLSAPRSHGWGALFRDLALIAGNRSLRFFSGTEYENGGLHFHFPTEPFIGNLKKLAELLQAK